MTRIAVVADIHGNMPALEAVIEDLAGQRVDEVLVGGDLVGRGPEGSRVVRRIRQLGWRSVRGNHEDYLLTFRRGQIPSEWLEADKWSASRWMAAELGDDDVDYLRSLPLSLTSTAASDLRLVHGSPRSNADGIGPWTSEANMQRHLDSVEESVLVCGHTHRPLERRLAGGLVVNAGSVGLPFNGDRRAQYALLHGDEGRFEVEFRRVDYDLRQILEIYESSGFLAQGGVTARLLKKELEQAQPFLVPFLQWTKALRLEPRASRIEEFCRFYDPEESMRSFGCRLAGLTADEAVD